MTWLKKTWIIPLFIIIVILCGGIFYISSLLSQDEQLSSDEISQQLERMYEGTIDHIKMEKGYYAVEMTRAGTVYAADVDAVNGKVLSMRRLSAGKATSTKILPEEKIREIIAKEYEDEIERLILNDQVESPYYEVEAVKNQTLVKVTIDAMTGEITSEEPEESSSHDALISREEAIEIAYTQLKGEVEYVKFKQTEDGGFYLIEIEQDNDDKDDLEAVIQIHAVTGKILSVVWDD